MTYLVRHVNESPVKGKVLAWSHGCMDTPRQQECKKVIGAALTNLRFLSQLSSLEQKLHKLLNPGCHIMSHSKPPPMSFGEVKTLHDMGLASDLHSGMQLVNRLRPCVGVVTFFSAALRALE